MLVMLGVAACSRSPTTQPAPASGPRPGLSPRETVTRLIEARETGAYHQMTPLIVPQRSADVLATLLAVDDFLNANQQLCEVVRRQVGLGLAQAIDRSRLAYDLDIFSRYVELLDETVTGDTARVSFLVDGGLPARYARLRLVEGTWRYDPGVGDYQQLAEAFRRMARGLRLTIDEIREGRLPPEELRDNPARLHEEVRVRLRPGLKMLPAPPSPDGDGG